jgi:cytochrome P450
VALLAAARKGDLQARLFAGSASGSTADLDDLFTEIRSHGRLHKGAFSYLTASHATVKTVLTSNDFRSGIAPDENRLPGRLAGWSAGTFIHPVAPPSLLVSEPPDHTRYRKLVTRVFTVRAVENLRGRVEEIANELLDRLDPASPTDLVETYCSQLPVTVIAEILGGARPRAAVGGRRRAQSRHGAALAAVPCGRVRADRVRHVARFASRAVAAAARGRSAQPAGRGP